jgi:hypothetical protein
VAKLSRLGSTRELGSVRSSPARSTTPCRFNTPTSLTLLARVSASWLACTLILDRWSPKWTPFTLFWAPSCATASSRPYGSDRQILKAWQPIPPCPQFDHYTCFPASSPFFSLFPRPPSPLSWRNEISRLKSYSLEPNLTAIRRKESTERKTALEITESTT